MNAIRIVEERPPYLLLCRGDDLFAVVERRAGKLYNLHSGHRVPEPMTDAGAEHAVGDHGWHDEAFARLEFAEITGRYREIAEHLR
jgi:hypothetical protein